MFGSAQKGIKHWILNRCLLLNSEMWIRMAIKLPHDLGVCQKTVGNSAGDFHGGGERKTPTSWTRTAIKSPTSPCIWWKSLTSPWETRMSNPGCRCFSLTTPVKIPGRITYCFLTNTEALKRLWWYIKVHPRSNVFRLAVTETHHTIVWGPVWMDADVKWDFKLEDVGLGKLERRKTVKTI